MSKCECHSYIQENDFFGANPFNQLNSGINWIESNEGPQYG
ncbi:hypothetical protein MADA3029_900040 [Vibrio nigripulchritudo MADA3029]|uniref:Uncharacterized protein n=1 Tax=Vibrio nigripulchritudo TaxID=28173 RepID=U4KHN5_9VIBR|nr:hypothetical protein VIBNIMADA3020_1040003 [Vibrio nigripulchritudo MADA3020]CCN51734.1 hypothetical protein VIBNIMADA3021_1160039 [Vibrio nigripulchritudo MADA3021]CCN61898.1 hypothetical protein MADA3029_900040 [Vibrio nigripulchritudo MADA3029]CCN83058.1 hypothetical protein VIBNIBLFn1_550107 [Vibrio nigripulchritudo BLFn1]CCN90674.1 hypothetical protein VIBNISFn27_750037 [Vibrio nigripulchritudo SFn27]CCN97261.1 hypothetical protein VIBNIENn2_920037 [Vibrio nigripulchritudo ENn2]CCO398